MPAKYEGFANLQTPQDLLGKLRRDYDRLENDRSNPDVNFNFFVTAYHMLDWVIPGDGKEESEKRKALELGEPLLQICSHIANGAKHFSAGRGKHTSVSDIRPAGLLLANPDTGKGIRFENPLTSLFIVLDGDAREIYGDVIFSDVLARYILNFWIEYLKDT